MSSEKGSEGQIPERWRKAVTTRFPQLGRLKSRTIVVTRRWAPYRDRRLMDLRERLVRHMEVDDGEFTYVYRCGTEVALRRAQSALKKEAGTVGWIKAEVRDGDVFYDIGANVGLYAVMAAMRVRPSGRVVAFEPHAANIETLLRNVAANGLNDVVTVVSAALDDEEGFFDFNYLSLAAGSSRSQLRHTVDAGTEFVPATTELKYATTVDRLVETGAVPPPTLVKMDVDGNEPRILKGMQGVLRSADRPRSVQVEVLGSNRVEIDELMAASGYRPHERHYSPKDQRLVTAGADPLSVVHNVIFRPT